MGDDNWKPVKTGDDISVFVTVSMTVINFRQMPELGLNAFHGSVYIGDSDVISSYHIYASCFSAML